MSRHYVPPDMRTPEARRFLNDLGTQILKEHRRALDGAGKETSAPREVRVKVPYAVALDKPPVKGWVYVVEVKPGLVKVGAARNVEARLKVLQVSSPDQLRLVSKQPVPSGCDVFEAERECHAALWTHHRRGEWFDMDAAEAADCVKRILEAIGNRRPNAKPGG